MLQPAQRIVFLGFVLDSLHMSICLSDKRKSVILDICKKLNSGASHKIQAVASAVGCLIAALPGVKYGPSHVGGRWTVDESPVHINVLELHAAKLTLLALAPNVSHSHIRFMLDNTTAAAYIDKMGGACTPPLAMRLLCLYGIGQRTETFGCLLPSSRALRTVADFHSRNFRDNTEWMLNPVVFKQLSALSFVPVVDLFASRLNCQLTPFVSWKPEPGAWAVNAFLAKDQQVGATGMLVTPFWSTQP